jgi:hypothetical protein
MLENLRRMSVRLILCIQKLPGIYSDLSKRVNLGVCGSGLRPISTSNFNETLHVLVGPFGPSRSFCTASRVRAKAIC